MKSTLGIIALTFVAFFAYSETGESGIRLKLEWLNAKECGVEGCKPQNIVLNDGGSVSFFMPNIGMFELQASSEGVRIRSKLAKLEKDEAGEFRESEKWESIMDIDKTYEFSLGIYELALTAKLEDRSKNNPDR